MMKKFYPLGVVFIIFAFLYLYLHQKVQIYVQGYKLSNSYQHYSDLMDKKDYLMYSFAREVSLSKVNHWAEKENFVSVARGKVVALNNYNVQTAASQNKMISLLNRFFSVSTPDTALAKE